MAVDQHSEEAVLEQDGAYEVLRKRLENQAQTLSAKTESLNEQRTEVFGSQELTMAGRARARTENNCVARDLVRIGDTLLFGYNVFIGLKQDTAVSDVFELYKLHEEAGHYHFEPVDMAGSLLDDSRFKNDFRELYAYYKQARLISLRNTGSKLLAAFQTGKNLSDIRVFRWAIDNNQATYIDNRGEREMQLPPSHPFEWVRLGRDHQSNGAHPHLNVLDKLFIETINGDLTIKVEDNTETGQGIYSEPVNDSHQSLDDADISYAEVSGLILLKVKPYREEHYRYLVFNPLMQTVIRQDVIGQACLPLPEDHGIIFPGGYYLTSGEEKLFSSVDIGNLEFKRRLRSPNGEDVLYVFYEHLQGRLLLCSYNLIRKEMDNPLGCHGYAFYDDGRLVVFSSESEEPTRIHPMQIWQTAYCSDEFAAAQPQGEGFLTTIGNAEVVRAVSDLYSVSKSVLGLSPSSQVYRALIDQCRQLLDSYHWLEHTDVNELNLDLNTIMDTGEQVLDEFDKALQIRKRASQLLVDAEQKQQAILTEIQRTRFEQINQFVDFLEQLKAGKGYLLTIRDTRYIDVARLGELDTQLDKRISDLSGKTVEFAARSEALQPWLQQLDSLQKETEESATTHALKEQLNSLGSMEDSLNLLVTTLSGLEVDDATVRAEILERTGEVFARLNQVRAGLKNRQKSLGAGEAIAEFGAQFRLFGMNMSNALSRSDTPEKCDDELARLSVQLEELESRFADHEEFLSDILDKRDDLYDSFQSRRQTLMDERQRRAQRISDSAGRVLDGIEKRTQAFTELEPLNSFFAADNMVHKVRSLSESLMELDDSVKAEALIARLKGIQDQATKAVRDKAEIYENGGDLIKLGKHRFTVNRQALDVSLVPREEGLFLHLTGTRFYEKLDNEELDRLQDLWDQPLVSENSEIYRAEYLAWQIFQAGLQQTDELNEKRLEELRHDDRERLAVVQSFATPRYQEGYEKGIHDQDASRILKTLLDALHSGGLLRYSGYSRALVCLFWQQLENPRQILISSRAKNAGMLNKTLFDSGALRQLEQELSEELNDWWYSNEMPGEQSICKNTASYLIAVLAEDNSFALSAAGQTLARALQNQLEQSKSWQDWQKTLQQLSQWPEKQWQLAMDWVQAFAGNQQLQQPESVLADAAICLIFPEQNWQSINLPAVEKIEKLSGVHSRLNNGELTFVLDEFCDRLTRFSTQEVKRFHALAETRHKVLADQRKSLRLTDFKARPLASFVRNRLINEVFLPIIGDNLAKQMGSAGDDRRTDQMGLLLLISPPGYGKTTLIEYVANRLGLIFMKINCPSLGHEVTSLDPAQAPNATARQELEKLNLALEMGDNCMLYLDDIQHTDPEFLQKFISLCDGTRRIEGVWKGETKTYDLRGRKFCVCMAGNPYTESGDVFKIPDMLANRADIYNLGDILGDSEDAFCSSYIENCLTSNSVLAPLTRQGMDDVYKVLDIAKGKGGSTSELAGNYSGAEVQEMVSVLQKLLKIQDVVFKVNQSYISSAAQADSYRTEPPFKLQGSYRNMNKMAEKVVAIMNDDELQSLIADHYIGEAQTLTQGAEENLLKLAELRGTLAGEGQQRWQTIKEEYTKQVSLGGEGADSLTMMAGQVVDMNRQLGAINSTLQSGQAASSAGADQPSLEKLAVVLSKRLDQLNSTIAASSLDVEVVNHPVPGLQDVLSQLAGTIETSFVPVARAMNEKIGLDLNILRKVNELTAELRSHQNKQVTQRKTIKKIATQQQPVVEE
ncbi:DNA repair ATPase [Endozoicomonas sp. OPT23]|uniref:DNA repair ATPase n=1 Tax=Endozoicomonas sp. OPT23 TaxID=2072845 RepID=UPI00351AEE5F